MVPTKYPPRPYGGYTGTSGPCGPTGRTGPVMGGQEYEYPVEEAPKPTVICFYCRTPRENIFKSCPRCGGSDIVQPPDPLTKQNPGGTISCGPR